MSKWEMAKTLMIGMAYLLTGLALILGILVALGPIMDALVKLCGMAMPLWISLIPLLVTFVGVGWGAYFIWKSAMGRAPGVAFYLIGKAGYKVLALRHISVRRRRGIGILVTLVGLVMVCVEIIPAGIRIFSTDTISLAHPLVALAGLVAIIVSIAIVEYEPESIPQNG